MTRSYTRTGDNGTTGRFGGRRVKKSHPLLDAVGALDQANAAIGLARSLLRTRENIRKLTRNDAENIDELLREAQDMLFRVGADLSTPFTFAQGEPPVPPRVPRIAHNDTKSLEQKIDALEKKLPDLHQFILPGGTQTAAALHLARATIRQAEREFIRAEESGDALNPTLKPFLNRLSSYLFALARYANRLAGHTEEHPRYR